MENKKNSTFREVIFYILAGAVGTVVGTAIMYLAYNFLHWNYWVSSALNYVFGGICTFFLNKKMTFRNGGYSVGEVIRYIINVAVSFLIGFGIARPLCRVIFSSFEQSLQDNISMLAGMLIYNIPNYLGMKFFVFKKKD